MSEFALDNEGSGFAVDDEEDFDAMFSASVSAAEDTGEDVSSFLSPAEKKSAPSKKPEKEEIREEKSEPAPQPPMPVVEEPKKKANDWTSRKIHIPSLEDQITQVRKILNVYQAYTQLGPQEKSVVAQLVSRDDLSDEYAFVVGVLNADPMLARTVITFLQAKEMESVDRAFFVIDLESELLSRMGKLVEVFLNDSENLPNMSDRTQYVHFLVNIIDRLDPKTISYVRAAGSVLKAAEL